MKARVLKAPAGLGKTRLYAAIIARDAGVKIWEVYCATIALAEELRVAIQAENPRVRVQLILGRTQELRPGIPLCQRAALAEEVSKAGLPVFQSICRQNAGPGQPPIKCPHYDKCHYIQQFGRADVYIYTHAHLQRERGPLEVENWWPQEVLIDESFVMSMYEPIEIPITMLQDPRLPPEASALCRDIAAAASAGLPLWPRLQAASRGRPSELNKAIKALSKVPTLTPSSHESALRKDLKRQPNLRPVAQMLTQLKAEMRARPGAEPQSIEWNTARSRLVLHYRHSISRFQPRHGGLAPRITILDASADEQLISRFFEVEQFEALRVERNAHVIQCSSTRGSTTSLVPARNKDKASRAKAQQRLGELEALIKRLVSDGNKVLVVGPSEITGNPNKGKRPLLRIPRQISTRVVLAHFNAVRGVDAWKDCDVAVIVGRNEPPVAAVEGIGRALHHDAPNPLHLPGEWTVERRGYRLTSGSKGVDTVVHRDRRIQAVLEQMRECESVQAIDRLRLVHATEPKLVYVLSNIPLDLDVDELRTWGEIMHGTRLEQAWDRGHGVLPLSADWLAARHPDLWPSEGAAKKDVQRWGAKKGQISNGVFIRNLSPLAYQYKRPSARSWSVCLSTLTSAGEVQAELKRLLGSDVQVRNPAHAASAGQPQPVTTAPRSALAAGRPGSAGHRAPGRQRGRLATGSPAGTAPACAPVPGSPTPSPPGRPAPGPSGRPPEGPKSRPGARFRAG